MKSFRTAIFASLACLLSSCATWNGLKNCYPIRILDQTGSALLGYLAENETPADKTPDALKDRAQKVEARGIYAGRTPAAQAPRQSMAAR